MAIEARQARDRVDRRHVAGRFDDEDRRLVGQRQAVAPVRVGERDIAAVGDEDIGDAGALRVAPARAVEILEDETRNRRRLGRRLRRTRRRQGRREPARRADQTRRDA